MNKNEGIKRKNFQSNKTKHLQKRNTKPKTTQENYAEQTIPISVTEDIFERRKEDTADYRLQDLEDNKGPRK